MRFRPRSKPPTLDELTRQKTKLTPEMCALLDQSLHDLGIDERIVNQLEQSGILTTEDLLCTSREQLLKIDNVGERTLRLLLEVLAAFGFEEYK